MVAKREGKSCGDFLPPLQKATTWPTLDNQNHQYFGPAWGSFFCRRKSSIDSNSFGQSPSPNKPGTEKRLRAGLQRADGLNLHVFFFGFPPGYFALQILSAQVSTLNAWLGGMSWLLHHGPARKLGSRGVGVDGHHQPRTGIRDTDIHHVNEEVEFFFPPPWFRMTRFVDLEWFGHRNFAMDEPTASKENSPVISSLQSVCLTVKPMTSHAKCDIFHLKRSESILLWGQCEGGGSCGAF